MANVPWGLLTNDQAHLQYHLKLNHSHTRGLLKNPGESHRTKYCKTAP